MRDFVDLTRIETGPFGEVAALIFATIAQKRRHAIETEPVIFIHGAQNGQTTAFKIFPLRVEANGFQQPVHNFAIIDTHDIIAAFNPQSFHAVCRHHANFSVSRLIACTDRIGVDLHKLAITPRPRFFIAPNRPELITPQGLGQTVEMLRDMARQRRGQVIAQAHPLPVIIFQREHALIRAVIIGQKLAQRIGIFKRRCVQSLKAVSLINSRDGVQHMVLQVQLITRHISKPTRRARFRLELFLLLGFALGGLVTHLGHFVHLSKGISYRISPKNQRGKGRAHAHQGAMRD